MRTLTMKPLKPSALLSKSKFVHGVQCPLYVWLEVRTDAPRPEVDPFTQALFDLGDEVGKRARTLFDQRLAARGEAPGVLVTDDPRLHDQAAAETAAALAAGASAVYEAAFTHDGVRVRVDVLERLGDGRFAINEVKSSSKYEESKHLAGAAVQTWVLRGEGIEVAQVRLVHINGGYVWPGGPYDLEQLFAAEDITAAVDLAQPTIAMDVARLLRVVRSDDPPRVPEGVSCSKPYDCAYLGVCPALGEPVEHPIAELPSCRRGKGTHKAVTEAGFESRTYILDTR